MSSIKKAVKKVFRPVKKVLKKVAKPALIIGASLFTAGIISGGFAAFSSVSGATTLGGKINAFMGAVGETIGKGASALTGGLIGGPSSVSQLAEQQVSTLPGAGGTVTQGGFLSGVTKALGSFVSTDVGKMIVAQGVMNGIQSYAAGREARRQERRYDESAVFGVRRRGSGGEGGMQPSDYQLTGIEGAGPPPSAEQYDPNRAIPSSPLLPQPQQYTAAPAPTQNPSLAFGGPTQPVLPAPNYDYDYRYMQGGYNTPGMGGGLLSPIPPNYG